MAGVPQIKPVHSVSLEQGKQIDLSIWVDPPQVIQHQGSTLPTSGRTLGALKEYKKTR